MKITKIVTAECSIPLLRIVQFAGRKITKRETVVLRIETDAGISGEAVAGPRGAPLLEAVKQLAPHFLGTDPLMRRQAMELLCEDRVNSLVALMPALSLFDVALWDIVAKRAQMPLFQLLGGGRRKVPVMPVAGYFLEQRTIEDVRDEVAGLMDKGYQRVKINLLGTDPQFDQRYVTEVSKVAAHGLSADVHWTWTSIKQALETCRRIDDAGLLFLEDPFRAHELRLTYKLQALLRTPLAIGEDIADLHDIHELVAKLRVFRLDASRCGGVTGAIEAIHSATLSGCGVVPHTSPTLHGQLAGAFPGIEAVEILADKSASGSIGLVRKGPTIVDGWLELDEEPGVGTIIDWEAVEQTKIQAVSFDSVL